MRLVAWNDDHVGHSEGCDAVVGMHRVPGGGGHRAGFGRTYRKAVVPLLVGVPKDLGSDRQIERNDLRQRERDDVMHDHQGGRILANLGMSASCHRSSLPSRWRRMSPQTKPATVKNSSDRHIGILLFDDVEELDAVGPWEVLAHWTRTHPEDGYAVVCISRDGRPVTAAKGLMLGAHVSVKDVPPLEVFLHPGGLGTRRLLSEPSHLDWIRAQRLSVPLMTSVCTGSLVYAAAGLLSERPVTTHWDAVEELRALDPSVQMREKSGGSTTATSSPPLACPRASTWPSISWRVSPAPTAPVKYVAVSNTTPDRLSDLTPQPRSIGGGSRY